MTILLIVCLPLITLTRVSSDAHIIRLGISINRDAYNIMMGSDWGVVKYVRRVNDIMKQVDLHVLLLKVKSRRPDFRGRWWILRLRGLPCEG